MRMLKTACAFVVLWMSNAWAETAITFTTEDYEPYHYKQGDQIVGSGTDQVIEIMRRAGLPFDISIMQFSRAIGLAENRANTCVFTAAHTPERAPRFHWIEPLFLDVTVLVRKGGASNLPTTLEEALDYRIGTQTADFTVEVLENLGAKNIQQSPQIENTVSMLEVGRVDFMAIGLGTFEDLVTEGRDLEFVTELTRDVFSIACSLDTPRVLVDRMQMALDSMIGDGTQDRIVASYTALAN